MNSRREQILATSAELFAQHGFHGVSMAEIGEACGISGPALYKHVASKEALLAESLISSSRDLVAGGEEREGDLDALIAFHADFATRRPALIVIQEREWSNLSDAARTEVRRLQLSYIDVWVRTVAPSRPDWDRRRARAGVQAVFGLLNSTPHSARISAPAMRGLLQTLARDALVGG
jgi:AcrR family transcriptional regulator